MNIKKTKLHFKGKSKTSKPAKNVKTPKDSSSDEVEKLDESKIWFNCEKLEHIYGPCIIKQKDQCLSYDDIQQIHIQNILDTPTNVAQVFVIKPLFEFIGITNSDGFYLNSNFEFNSAAMGAYEQFTVEKHNDQFAFKSNVDNKYVSLVDRKLQHSDTIVENSLFTIMCQSKVVNNSKRKRKTITNTGSLGLPTKKVKK